MNRNDCLTALERLQCRGVRCREWQRHPEGKISAASPWVVSAWDPLGLRCDFDTLRGVTDWLKRYPHFYSRPSF